MIQLFSGGVVAAVAAHRAAMRRKAHDQHRRIELYDRAVAVALATWGGAEDDLHRLDPGAYRRCRDAMELAAGALVTGRSRHLRTAAGALSQAWATASRTRRPARATTEATEHLLSAPALAELTADQWDRRGGRTINLHALRELAEDTGPSQRTLERLVRRLHGQRPCELTVEQLLELDDNDLRHALEALAVSRKLWVLRVSR